MSIKTKLAALTIAAITVVAATTAEAKPKIGPIVAGTLLGAAVVGTTIAAATQPSYGYYPHQRHCFLKPQYNMFGQFMGYAKVCHWH